jgi:adenosine deaminase
LSETSHTWTELHRHLDISMRLATLLEMAQAVGIEPTSTQLEAFGERIVVRRPLGSLAEVLETFRIVQLVLDRSGHLERVAYETVHDCWNEGTGTAELRFSPSYVCAESGMIWSEALAAFHAGLERALGELPGMRAGLLCIASRDFGPDAVGESVEFYLEHLDRFAGFDLAGDEEGFPARMFEDVFEPIRRAKAARPERVHVTIHAGEASGPESVWEAIEILGAERIGHGIHSFRDPALVRYLAERRICLEMCPTSNWLTGAVARLEEHPLRAALESGVAATINTDDPTIFGVTLGSEVRLAREVIGLSDEQIAETFEIAAASTFLP